MSHANLWSKPQLEGVKHWRLYDSPRPLPLKAEDPIVPRDRLSPSPQEVLLEPGDLLYLPRGVVHEAFTGDRVSLHLTVGVEVVRWADLLADAIAAASRHEEALREAVPPGWLAGAPEVAGRFRELLRLVAERAAPDEALADLGEKFIGGLAPLPSGRFAEPPEPPPIDLDTPLVKRPGSVCQVTAGPQFATIRFPGNAMSGPAAIGPALRFVAAAEGPLTARALPEGLTDNARLVLLRRLVRDGLLTTHAPAAP